MPQVIAANPLAAIQQYNQQQTKLDLQKLALQKGVQTMKDSAQASALERQAFTGAGTMADKLERTAEAQAQHGLADQAAQTYEQAQQARLRDFQIQNQKLLHQDTTLKLAHQKIVNATSLLSGPPSKAKWDRMNAVYARTYGQPSPYADVPYSPEVYQAAQQDALSTKDKLDMALKQNGQQLRKLQIQSTDQLRAQEQKQMQQYHNSLIDLQKQRLQEQQKMHDASLRWHNLEAKTKAAEAARKRGKDVAPSDTEELHAQDVLASTPLGQHLNAMQPVGKGSITPQFRSASYIIAAKAKAYRAGGDNAETAMQKAIQDFQTEYNPQPEPSFFGSSSTWNFNPMTAGQGAPGTPNPTDAASATTPAPVSAPAAAAPLAPADTVNFTNAQIRDMNPEQLQRFPEVQSTSDAANFPTGAVYRIGDTLYRKQ